MEPLQPLECIVCGSSVGKHDGVCDQCFIEKQATLSLPEYVNTVVCPHCGAMKRGEHWLTTESMEEVVEHVVKESVSVGPKVESWDVELEIQEETPHLYNAIIHASLFMGNLSARRETRTTVRVSTNVCDVCSRRHGGYYESIVQLRGYDSPLSKDEKEDMAALASDIVSAMSSSNRQVFLSKYEEIHGGLDFYLSTTDAGKHLSRELSQRTGGHVKESARMAGRKDGKDIYRITFSIRLPPFKRNEYILLDNTIYRVLKVARDRVDLLVLKTGDVVKRRRDFDHQTRILGGEELLKDAVVVFDQGDELQLMDPDNYKTVQIRKPSHYEEDETVSVIKHEGQLYIA